MSNAKFSIGKVELAMDIKGAEHLHLVMTPAMAEEFKEAVQSLVGKHVGHLNEDDICVAKINHVAEFFKGVAPLRPMSLE